jgi:hypothetical protein
LPPALKVLVLRSFWASKIKSNVLPPTLRIICFKYYKTIHHDESIIPKNYTGKVYYKTDMSKCVFDPITKIEYNIAELEGV